MELICKGLLFDLDGTLVDSLPAVDRAWTTWCLKHSLDPVEVLPQIHGRKAIDSIRLVAPHLDAEAEDMYLRVLESTDTDGVVALPGAIEFLKSLPPDRWGVVTSGTTEVATARLLATGIPKPHIAVFGEEVAHGKPAPDPFLLGASRLGIDPADLVAFEDTVPGLRSIQAAGIRPVAVGMSFEPMILDYRSVSTVVDGEILRITLETDVA